MNTELSKLISGPESTLKDVMTMMDQQGQGVVFIIGERDEMVGLLTDGDIRRALLSSAELSEPARQHMRQDFVFGSTLKSREENGALLNERIRHLPVLDEYRRLVDKLSWSDFLWVPVMQPVLEGNEFKYVADCLVSNWISSQGAYVDRFQESFRKFLAVDNALCVSNGTAALHLAMAAMGVGPGDEVIVPDLTFISPASMAVWCGAKPVFVDVNQETWTLDPDVLEKRIGERTKAIVAVHLYGHPCDMDPILAIARKYGLLVIEDCAEAIGAEYKGRKVGALGDVGTFSFFANKIITTGEGGMVTTNNPELFEKMTLLRDHGMAKERRYWHEVAGFNYRLTNLQAAIGLAQMEKVDKFIARRVEIAERYNSQLVRVKGVTLPPIKPWAKNIYWLYSIVIDETVAGISRNQLASYLGELGIDTRPFFYPLHIQPPFLGQTEEFPVSSLLANQGLSLPTSNDIDFETIDRVCHSIKSELRRRT